MKKGQKGAAANAKGQRKTQKASAKGRKDRKIQTGKRAYSQNLDPNN